MVFGGFRGTWGFALGLSSFGAAMGCGPGAADDSSSDDTTVTTSTTAGDDLAATGSTSTGPMATTGGTSASDETTGASESSSTTDAPPTGSVCEPQPEQIRIVITVQDWPPGIAGNSFELPCTVTDIYPLADTPLTGIVFDCESGTPTVLLPLPHALDLAEGDAVELSVFIDEPWWSNVFVAIHRDGELVVAGMAADSLPADDGAPQHPAADFWAPLTVTAHDDVCDVETESLEPCFDELCPDCTRDRRLALELTHDAESSTVLDRSVGTLGAMEVTVGETVDHVEVFCTDTPNAWYSFVVARVTR